jgi:hypothetical protein
MTRKCFRTLADITHPSIAWLGDRKSALIILLTVVHRLAITPHLAKAFCWIEPVSPAIAPLWHRRSGNLNSK